MSTRSQVKLTSNAFTTPIYLYQHCDGYALYKIVCNAISRRARWTDPEYLARIIFSEMLKAGSYTNWKDEFVNALDEELGYGIGTGQHGDITYRVDVDIDNQIVREMSGYDNSWECINETTFDDARATLKEDLYKD